MQLLKEAQCCEKLGACLRKAHAVRRSSRRKTCRARATRREPQAHHDVLHVSRGSRRRTTIVRTLLSTCSVLRRRLLLCDVDEEADPVIETRTDQQRVCSSTKARIGPLPLPPHRQCQHFNAASKGGANRIPHMAAPPAATANRRKQRGKAGRGIKRVASSHRSSSLQRGADEVDVRDRELLAFRDRTHRAKDNAATAEELHRVGRRGVVAHRRCEVDRNPNSLVHLARVAYRVDVRREPGEKLRRDPQRRAACSSCIGWVPGESGSSRAPRT